MAPQIHFLKLLLFSCINPHRYFISPSLRITQLNSQVNFFSATYLLTAEITFLLERASIAVRVPPRRRPRSPARSQNTKQQRARASELHGQGGEAGTEDLTFGYHDARQGGRRRLLLSSTASPPPTWRRRAPRANAPAAAVNRHLFFPGQIEIAARIPFTLVRMNSGDLGLGLMI